MVVRCRSGIIPVETERDFKMGHTPIELQTRIKRLFLNSEQETQFQEYTKPVEPSLNTLENPKGIPLGTNGLPIEIWE